MSCLARARITFTLVTAVVWTSAVLPRSAAAQSSFAIRNVRVFDGQRVIPAATVLVENGKVAAVGPNARVPASVQAIDGAGRTLLPGLLDAHTHTIAPATLETSLAFGVTTQLDMFTVAAAATQLRAEQAAGRATSRADLLSASTLATRP